MEVILRATGLYKSYQTNKDNVQPVLHNVNLEVRRGEFVAVMGASGSGKSTLLYSVSGLDHPTQGQVEFDGKSLQTLKEDTLSALRLNQMGFIFQQSNLLKNLSVIDNIVLSGYLAKKEDRQIINKRALSLMKHLGIEDLANRDISQMSGGQLQRAAICRALINNPHMLFGDEPTGALNASSTADVMDILTDIHHSGTTILLVTHDPKVAARCGRVVYMSDGKIVSEHQLGLCKKDDAQAKAREKSVSEWLFKQGF